MFCTKCGKEIVTGARFCSFCGAPVERKPEITDADKGAATPPPITPGKKRSPAKIIIAAALGLCLLAGISVYCFTRYKEASYQNAVAAADAAIAEQNYDIAVESLNRAIHLKPEAAENYLTLATVYVEKADLYSANEVLHSGYSETADSMLKEVSIWGPVSDFEIALWGDEAGIPLVRQEYRFSEAGIQGLLNGWGQTMFVTTYFYDDAGRLAHTTLSDYTSYAFGGGDAAVLDAYSGYDLLGEIDVNLDYSCDEAGRTVSVYADGEPVSTIVYGENGIVDVFFGERKTTLHYGSDGRVTQIDSPYGDVYEFQYNADGSFYIVLPDNFGILRFDDRGCWTAFEGEDADAFSVELDHEGRVLRVTGDEDAPSFSNEYSDNGLLKKSTWTESSDDYITVRCTYDSQDRLIRLDYEDASGYLNGTYRDIEYDEYGRISRMVQYSPNEDYAWEACYEYTDARQIASIVLSSAYGTYLYEPVYSSYGGIIDCAYTKTADASEYRE